MKKTMILAAAALVAGSALAAEVLSVNAVGFIQTTCPAGEYRALSLPFYGNDSDLGGTAWVNTEIAQNAAVGSKVYFWDATGWDVSEYVEGRTGKSWNGSGASKILAPGEAFLYQPAVTQVATVSGEVPDEATFPLDVAGAANYSALGLPYPAEKAWTATELAEAAPVGAKVYFWDATGWDVSEYVEGRTGKSWNGSGASKVLDAGEGFLYQLPATSAGTTIEAVRPYDWPAEPIEIVNP